MSISAFDAALILQYGVEIIDTFPADTGLFNIFASGDISMNDDEIQPGQEILVPLNLTNGLDIYSFEGVIEFNSEHLSFVDIEWSNLLEEFSISVNNINDKIYFAGASINPDGQEGVFANLVFEVSDNFNEDLSIINLNNLRWNEELPIGNVSSSNLYLNTSSSVGYSLSLHEGAKFN